MTDPAGEGPDTTRKLPMIRPAGEAPEAEGRTDELPEATGPDRRTAIKWLALAAAAPAVASSCTPETDADGSSVGRPAGDSGTAGGAAGTDGGGASLAMDETRVGNPMAAGTPWDPDLVLPRRHWPLVLTQDEREGLAVLCDVIIPADEVSPSASSVGAVDYIDEWVSAPYEGQRRDLVLVRGGLGWLDREAAARFGGGQRFRDLGPAQQTAICDDICWLRRAATEHRMAARFFAKVRDLTATAFYTTDAGMADIGYVGNTALARWEAPPDEVLRHLGLA